VRSAVALAACAVLAIAASTSGSGAPADDPHPGDRGVVLTAIRGTQIEEIPVTYIARQHDATGPGYDLHLVELDGPIAERVGVAAGMSGSPVYFGGRLIGALSYRLGVLPVEAIAGVTPIEDVERAAPSSAAGLGTPIATPVHVAGLSELARAWIEPQLEELGLRLVAGDTGSGASGGPSAVPTELRPGSPVGVALVRGDLPVAATGTVTLVEGDRVYAFGHPFLGVGRADLPMVTAEVIHTLADDAGSVKLSRIGEPVGAIVDDRLTAIVGRLGAAARMVPVTLHVAGRAGGEQTLHFDIARSPTLTPLLAGLVVVNGLVGSAAYEGQTTAVLSGRLRIRGHGDVPIALAAASNGGQDPALAAGIRLQQVVSGLWRNSLAQIDLEAIEVDVTFADGIRSYQVDAVHYDRAAVKPGARVSIACSLRPYRGALETRRVEITVPIDVPRDASLTIAVGPQEYVDQILGQPLARRVRSARDIGAAIEALSEMAPANRLQVVLLEGRGGLVARGRAYGPLPPTAERLLAGAPGRTSRTTASVLSRAEVVLDGPVDGGVVVPLELEAPGSEGP
jgi:hypothetical protein